MKITLFKRKSVSGRRIILLAFLCGIPVLLTALFYILRSNTAAMDAVGNGFTSHIRAAIGLACSILPFSVAEVLITLAIALALFFIVSTVVVLIRRDNKLKQLGKRMLTAALVALYAWTLFCWLWNASYFESGFAERNGLTGDGISAEDLYSAALLFAEQANRLAPLVPRDGDGSFSVSWSEMRSSSAGIYTKLETEFPSLSARALKPKPMFYSKFMSLMGYTGFYFALTGEASVNTDAPVCYMPVTIAHELAHLRGVAREDEANFVGIAACITSDDVVYQYSGYLSGLSYLLRALVNVDFALWAELHRTLCPEILLDWSEHDDYWAEQETPDTGIEILDEAVTVMSETVDVVYDDFLKSNGQELGMRSYGACVDLLVRWTCG